MTFYQHVQPKSTKEKDDKNIPVVLACYKFFFGIQHFGAETMANRSSEGEGVRRMGGRSRRRVEPYGLDDELIPRIPDEITTGNIVTKLPVADVLKLPLISRDWQQAVQIQKVRSARLRQSKANSLRLVPVIDLSTVNIYNIRLALHSRDYMFFGTLPPIPRYWTRNDPGTCA